MLQPMEFVDVADSDFLSDNEHLDEEESDSESEIEKFFVFPVAKNRLFDRKRPLHVVLGAGKSADIILWRDKNVSASVLAGITIIWFLFEGMGYNLLTLLCHFLILLLAMLFLWPTFAPSANLPPLEFPEFILPEGLLVNAALSVRNRFNQGFRAFRVIAYGEDYKTFFLVTVTLWGLSVVGSWEFSFITLLYIVSVIIMIVPMLYEKHEDVVDIVAENILIELKSQSAELMNKFRELRAVVTTHNSTSNVKQ